MVGNVSKVHVGPNRVLHALLNEWSTNFNKRQGKRNRRKVDRNRIPSIMGSLLADCTCCDFVFGLLLTCMYM